MGMGRLAVYIASLLVFSLVLGACTGKAATPTPDVGPSSAPAPSGFANPDLLVDTAWLARNLNSTQIRILDLRTAEKYQEGHISGAVSLPSGQITTTVNGLPNMALPADDFGKLMGQAGIDHNTHVVIVDDGNMLWASRLLWTLEYYGHKKASVLHGGQAAWQADAREVTRKAPTVTTVSFKATPNPALVADLSEVLRRLKDPKLVLLDNRSTKEYTGEELRSQRGGHIPGAVNIDWTTHLNAGTVPTLKSPAELRDMYQKAGITKDKEVASYCQTAIRAAHGYLVLRLLGYDKLKVYDGSWVEWGNRQDTPVDK